MSSVVTERPDDSLDLIRDALASAIEPLSPACVAFSGGVDSTVVLAATVAVLGANDVVAVTASSPTYLEEELEEARAFCAALRVRHEVVVTEELDDERFAANSPDRCYHCKVHLLERMAAVAEEHDCATLLDGFNADDLSDYRPGIRAADEHGVHHPLLEAGLGKEAVRALARRLGLPAWNRPANACLASRIPYGEPIVAENLRAVAAAEAALRGAGFPECRVRHHGRVARIEVPVAMVERAAGDLRRQIVAHVKAAGFTYVTLDLEGFRSGSMNEVLHDER